jgi:hypothetical protein
MDRPASRNAETGDCNGDAHWPALAAGMASLASMQSLDIKGTVRHPSEVLVSHHVIVSDARLDVAGCTALGHAMRGWPRLSRLALVGL